jgi:hypothetical protein
VCSQSNIKQIYYLNTWLMGRSQCTRLTDRHRGRHVKSMILTTWPRYLIGQMFLFIYECLHVECKRRDLSHMIKNGAPDSTHFRYHYMSSQHVYFTLVCRYISTFNMFSSHFVCLYGRFILLLLVVGMLVSKSNQQVNSCGSDN